MNIGVLGTGMVGQGIAATLHAAGHRVMVGTRDPQASLARLESGGHGEAFGVWHQKHPDVGVGTFREAAQFGEVLVNATNGTGSLQALEAAGEAALEGKILLDIANPLDFSRGMPPTLFVKDSDSLAEQLQRRFPNLRVVKTLNTMNVELMVNPRGLAGGDHTVFVSGDDAGARAEVVSHLQSWFGWPQNSIFDLGALETARGTEMLLPLWLRVFFKQGSAPFQFKVVR